MGILRWLLLRPTYYERPNVKRRGSLKDQQGDTDTNSDMESDGDSYVITDETFRGGRVHFFRQIPSFLVNLECFLAYAGMCLAHITLDAITAPARMVRRGFRLRDSISALYVLCGVLSLYLATPFDSRLYSSLYHIIRASSTIKLYVIFNILELADKLLSAFSTDIIEASWSLMRSRRIPKGTSKAPPANAEPRGGIIEIAVMVAIACVMVMLHTIVLLCHVITINVSVNSEGSSLTGLLISNNFVEVKSVVFKKNTAEALQSVAFQDAVEGVQHVLFIIAMLLQHLTSEGPGSLEIGQIALILVCEVAIDVLKHLCVARFNCLKLEVYNSYLHTCYLDVSLRKFLAATRLPVVHSYTSGKTDLSTAPTTHDLSHSHFIPNPAHRAAFVPFPYASLLIWAAWPSASGVRYIIANPLLSLLCLALFISVTAFLKTYTLTWAAAYVLTLVRKDHRIASPDTAADTLSPSISNNDKRTPLSSTPPPQQGDATVSGRTTKQAPSATPEISDLIRTPSLPSPIVLPASPQLVDATPISQQPPPTPVAVKPRVYIVIDPSAQALLDTDKYDLQAGKKKK